MRTLYHCAGARSMRSVWLLHELGLEFELVTLPFDMAGLRTPAYLAEFVRSEVEKWAAPIKASGARIE